MMSFDFLDDWINDVNAKIRFAILSNDRIALDDLLDQRAIDKCYHIDAFEICLENNYDLLLHLIKRYPIKDDLIFYNFIINENIRLIFRDNIENFEEKFLAYLENLIDRPPRSEFRYVNVTSLLKLFNDYSITKAMFLVLCRNDNMKEIIKLLSKMRREDIQDGINKMCLVTNKLSIAEYLLKVL